VWVCDRSLAGIVGSNIAEGHGFLSAVSVVCCQVEFGLATRPKEPTECGVTECDRVSTR
jgi:hypothetical protein